MRGRANRAIGKITSVSVVNERETISGAPVTPREGDKLSLSVPGDGSVVLHIDILRRTDKTATALPPTAFWNGITRAWFVDVDGAVVRLDPQPPAPGVGGIPVSPRIDL